MNYKEYTVKVYDNGTKYWFLHGELHREDGPAIECANGDNRWYLNSKNYTKEEYNQEIFKLKNKNNCEGKVVEIDGKKYKLISV